MKPKVYLIGRPRFNVEVFLAFLREQRTEWHRTPRVTEPEEIVEVSGRICYMSFGEKQSPRTNTDYIRNLIRQGHESVLEHVSWTILLTGVSRAFTHQLVRHRTGFSFSQLSQQYHEETGAAFVEPPHIHQSPRALQAWQKATEVSRESYKVILESLSELDSAPALPSQKREFKRAIRSAARAVLPNATETKIVITANARALRHFFKVRGAIPGDVEMREVVAEIFKLIKPEAPSLFADFSLESLSDGSLTLTHKILEDSPNQNFPC
ncbi:MAG: FAD-dependent thymidylate synthase [Acidobacteriales bacterium]|nr:FAD-dependent thymidylate synthase [Terriglobales bacterium]